MQLPSTTTPRLSLHFPLVARHTGKDSACDWSTSPRARSSAAPSGRCSAWPRPCRDTSSTTFASFPEGGRCAAFLDEVRDAGSSVPTRSRLPQRSSSDPRTDRAAPRDRVRRAALPRLQGAHPRPARGAARRHSGGRGVARLDRRDAQGRSSTSGSTAGTCGSWTTSSASPTGRPRRCGSWCRVPESRLSVIRNSARLAAFETRSRVRATGCWRSSQ